MDVMLDSNVILADIRFEGTGLAGLLDYARRKGDFVSIPQVAFEEIKARYKERLKGMASGIDGMRQSLFVVGDKLPQIEIDAEMEALEKHLNQPDKRVPVAIYKMGDKIKAIDVANRGIHRKRPANDNGEELRDVMIWLTALEYAKESRRPLAFISRNKKAFCESKDSTAMHPHLVEDCANAKVEIHLYTDVLQFIQAHALEQTTVKATEVPEVIKIENLDSQSAMFVRNVRTAWGYPSEFNVESLEFVSGTSFKISQETDVVEYHFKGTALLTFAYFANYGMVSTRAQFSFDEPPASGWSHVGPSVWINRASPTGSARMTVGGSPQVRYEFEITISARFRNGRLSSWEAETFRYLEPND